MYTEILGYWYLHVSTNRYTSLYLIVPKILNSLLCLPSLPDWCQSPYAFDLSLTDRCTHERVCVCVCECLQTCATSTHSLAFKDDHASRRALTENQRPNSPPRRVVKRALTEDPLSPAACRLATSELRTPDSQTKAEVISSDDSMRSTPSCPMVASASAFDLSAAFSVCSSLPPPPSMPSWPSRAGLRVQRCMRPHTRTAPA